MQPGRYYHVFNRGNAGVNIFYEQRNYGYFLRKYYEYLSPVLDTYCYSLLPNHFHLLVRVKEEAVVEMHRAQNQQRGAPPRGMSRDGIPLPSNPQARDAIPGLREADSRDGIPLPCNPQVRDAIPPPSDSAARWVSELFRRFFISYSQAIIKQEKPKPGSLFQKNFKRIEVESEVYFWNLVLYIHTNAQLHGWHDDFREHEHNSYHLLLHAEPTPDLRSEALDWFGGVNAFEEAHLQRADLGAIEQLLIEEDPFTT
jgi:putative transposase